MSNTALFEQYGVDLGALTRQEGLLAADTPFTTFTGIDFSTVRSMWTGSRFGAALNDVGEKAEKVVEDEYWFSHNRESDFHTMVKEGVITPLSDAETKYYQKSVESLA